MVGPPHIPHLGEYRIPSAHYHPDTQGLGGVGLAETIQEGRLKRRPGSKRTIRIPEAVEERHRLLVSLWKQGLTLQECADTVGLKSHQSAWYHVNEKCRCGL